MKKLLQTIFALTLISTTFSFNHANAQPTTPKRGGVCIAASFRGSNSVLSCEHIGDVTIKQIYEKGFRIVFVEDTKLAHIIIIEEQ